MILTLTVSMPLASASLPSPPAVDEANIICSSSDTTDCYPKIFIPQNHFQVIREGQEIPPGLHVRLNVYTGQKEAKIYAPDEPEDSALEGFPVDYSVTTFNDEEASEETFKVPVGAPEYDPVGMIKTPETPSSMDDHFILATSMAELRKTVSKNGTWQQAEEEKVLTASLQDLEDLAHDIYYGLKISEDQDAVKALFCLMTSPPDSEEGIERQAASIVAAATQNNPKALAQFARRWGVIKAAKCPEGAGISTATVAEAFFDSICLTRDVMAMRRSPRTVSAKVAALSGLVKDPHIKKDFLAQGGMGKLLSVVLAPGEQWDGARTKIGHFVLDNFLDENMGAVLGIWPPDGGMLHKEAEGMDCGLGAEGAASAELSDAGCWAFHVRAIAETREAGEGHWSQEIYEKLTGERIGRAEARHDDL